MNEQCTCVVFDLDDTLYYEADFVYSAYRHIAFLLDPPNRDELSKQMFSKFLLKEDVFDWILNKYPCHPGMSIAFLLEQYRFHTPTLGLSDDTRKLLDFIKKSGFKTGLVTDGRSITQRNKIKALGLEDYFDLVVISEEIGSEKPDPANYAPFSRRFTGCNFYFVADNTRKDFIVPVQYGWKTFCLKDNGRNIHRQDFSLLPAGTKLIDQLSELYTFL